MTSFEVRIKFEEEKCFPSGLCRICLSTDRKLSPLGEYTSIYAKISEPYFIENILNCADIKVCWECLANLRKILLFQLRVRKANDYLQIANDSLLGKSLSNLSIVYNTPISDITSQSNPDSEEIVTKCEFSPIDEENLQPIDENLQAFDEFVDDFHEGNVITEEINPELKEDSKTRRLSKNHDRWTRKRAMLNKKPKFQIVSVLTDFKEKNYKKVSIGHDELLKWLEKERHSRFYTTMRYRCEKCILGFNNEKSFSRHKSMHHKKDCGSFLCDICKTRFGKKCSLVTHCRNHYYKYECTLCGYACYKRYDQYYHFQYSHQRMFKCLKCGVDFWGRREFFKHYKEWHERFVCDHCGMSFKMRYCIKEHIRKQHSPLECKPCQKKFARYNGLWLHNKLKHATKKLEEAYCVECNKHFDNVYSYKWHLNNSVRHKPKKKVSVPCPGCDKVFSKNIYMKDHYDLVHLKKFKYRCEECDKNFIRNADLVKHNKRVHEGIQTPKNKICYVCGRGFSSNKILNNHIRTHTGERPFQCEYCPAKFAQKVAMTGHVRNIHFKEKKQSQSTLLSYY